MLELILVILMPAYGLYFLESMRCKEMATTIAQRECKLCEVQLLDQTVHQIRLSLSRDERHSWRVWREYRFEYTVEGAERLHGRLQMLGKRTLRVELESFPAGIH